MNDLAPSDLPNVSLPRIWLWLSVLTGALVTTTSLLGILQPATYARETEAWAIQAVGQDWTNLVVAVLLLASTWRVSRRSVRGYLVWLGTHLYLAYAFAIYAFALHFQFLFLAYVAVLGLSFYSLVAGWRSVDVDRLSRHMPEGGVTRAAGVLLLAVGTLFALLWLAEIVPAMRSGSAPSALIDTGLLSNPVHVLDLAFLLPAMVFVGASVLRGHGVGRVLAVPMMVFAITMGLGIVAMFGLSAAQGMAWPAPAAVLVLAIICASAWLTARFLAGVGRQRPGA